MPRIAISYRRADSIAISGRIYDRLIQHFGAQSVFMDLDCIPPGVDFRQHIDKVLRRSDVLIVVIGNNWTGATGHGSSRITEPSDPVRVEVETALALKTVLIPVLVGDAVMPNANELPPSLAEFTHRNAVKVDAGRDFNVHIDRLIKALSAIGLANPEAMPAVAVKEAAATGGKLTPAVLTAYVTVPLVLLLLAHYLFVIKLDLHTTYLRLAAIVIPLLLGLLLFGRDRQSHGVALLVATAVALGAVLGMHVVAAAIEGTSLIPAEPAEWQVAFEFFASIVLSAVAGYLAARMLHSAGWRRSR